VISQDALAVMIGVNRGFIWSLINRTNRHYRHFTIPKGKSQRHINAPRVGLKIIQKWLSLHLEKKYQPPDHVFGFVRGRSHICAANAHTRASWVLSLDIQNFFPTTPDTLVIRVLEEIGYTRSQAVLIASLCCLNGSLAQGSPASPLLSNLAFRAIDTQLAALAARYAVRVTRYADDVTLSGADAYPDGLKEDVLGLFTDSPWRISDRKTELQEAPRRLKVHGLLVHGSKVRLTKGYRNRIRAYKHLVEKEGGIKSSDLKKVRGHLQYAVQVDKCMAQADIDKV
jgi:hypothetical protein